MNPFNALLHSRKFWLAMLDAFAAILALWIAYLVPADMAKLIMATWGAIQPVFVTLIYSIAKEDSAAMLAFGVKEEPVVKK